MRTVYQRNIFIDSESGSSRGDKLSCRLNFPPANFSIKQGAFMRLTLSQFQMKRQYYNINQYNNTFFLYDPAGPTYTPITIAPGNYTTFGALATAIQTAVAAVVGGSTCTHDPITRKFTITLGGAAPAASYFVSFQLKKQGPPSGVNPDFKFMDTHEILGGYPTRDGFGATPVNLFGTSVGPGAHVTPFVVALTSEECLYVRTTLQTNNFQSTGFELDTPLVSNEVIPTQILARIPLPTSVYQTATDQEFVTFEDPNNLFSVVMDIQQLSGVEFFLTDDKSRPIPSVASGQADAGLLNYKMTMKWEVLEHEAPPSMRPVTEPRPDVMKVSQSFH